MVEKGTLIAAYVVVWNMWITFFFTCHLATMIIKEVFNPEAYPTSLSEFYNMWLLGKGALPIRIIIFIFAGFTWALWTSRNKMAIEKKFPKAPTDVVYVALSLMQKWSIKLRRKTRSVSLTSRLLSCAGSRVSSLVPCCCRISLKFSSCLGWLCLCRL